MELLTANLAGRVRRERIGDREYLVAPMTLLVPGVLNGSQGPLFYPHDEVVKDPSVWNGFPITLQHPEQNGRSVSARNPGVLAAQGIGNVFNAKANGTLTAEAWFDVQQTESLAPWLISAVENGQKIELSTGLYTDNHPAENGANHNGRAYTHVARNYRPDHLAILPSQQGACSITDGCGVNVNTENNGDLAKLVALYRQTTNRLAGLLGVESPTGTQENTMAENAAARKKLIDKLIASCCWGEADRPTLNALPDEQVERFALKLEDDEARDAVINAVKETHGKELTVNAMPEALKKAAEAKAKAKDGDDEEEEDEDVKDKKKPTGNETKPFTEEQWLATAPESVRNKLAFAGKIEAAHKTKLIERLTANLEGNAKQEQVKRLQARSPEELEADLALLPAQPEPAETVQNWGGVDFPNVNTAPKTELTPMGLPCEYLPDEG